MYIVGERLQVDCGYGKLKYHMWGLSNPAQVGKWLWGERGDDQESFHVHIFKKILLLHSLVLYN